MCVSFFLGSNPDGTGSTAAAHRGQLAEVHRVYGGGLHRSLAEDKPRSSVNN